MQRTLVSRSGRVLPLMFALFALLVTSVAQARPKEKAEHEQMIGRLINSVRYGQDKAALAFMDGDTEARELLGAAYDKGTAEQRAEFVRLFHHIFAGVAFPKMRGNFEHLTTITYDPPEVKGTRTDIGSVIHIQAGPKEQELRVRYWLSKGADGKPRVVDVTIQGDKSMLTNIRDDQIQPILAEGGWTKLLDLMRERAKDLPAPADKPMAPTK
jgi:phospholipid transport system substrate-binding protein